MLEIQKEILFHEKHKQAIQSLLDNWFLMRLLDFIFKTKQIEGNIIELGSYKGGTALVLAHFLKRNSINKLIYSCDTFEGHPYDDKHGTDVKGSFKSTESSNIESRFRRFGVINDIQIIKGRFEDTLYKNLVKNRFSLAFIDCDLYQSTQYSLNFVIPRMMDGSVIVFHDYRVPTYGLTKAVHDFCEKSGLKVNIYPFAHIKIKKNPYKK